MTIAVRKEDFRYDTLRARHFGGSRLDAHQQTMAEANTSPAPRPVTYAGRFAAARQELMAASERGEGGRNALRQYSHRMDALVQQLFADAGAASHAVAVFALGGY
jgi:hypothetical protein